MSLLNGLSISDNHRRTIAATMTLLDKQLSQLERYCRGQTFKGPLYLERDDLSLWQKDSILKEIDATRRVLTEMRDHLALPVTAERFTEMTRAKSSILWASLVELESSHLQRYGRLPDGFGPAHDLMLQFILARLDAISHITRETHRP